MKASAPVARIAKVLGAELGSGRLPSGEIRAAGSMLAQVGATPDLAAGLLAESRRKRPDDRTIQGFAFLLESALDVLRIDANGGDPNAGPAIEDVRQAVEASLAAAPVEPAVMMVVARAFARSGLDPGPVLQASMAGALESTMPGMTPGNTSGPPSPADLSAGLDDVAAQLNHDPFAIHTEMAAMAAAFPADHRAVLFAGLATSAITSMREAALGFVLGSDPETAACVLGALAQPVAGHPVPSVLVERLVMMRPWLSEARRPALDAAIRALRPRAASPVPPQRAEIVRRLASPCDGAGAQSLFALLKHGRRFAVASVLLKSEQGVADAFVSELMGKRDADRMIGDIIEMADGVDISPALLLGRLADALSVNLAKDRPPPFGLVQVAEWLGLGPLLPEAVQPAELAQRLLAERPAQHTGQKTEQAAFRLPARPDEGFETLASWFEAGEAVEIKLRHLKTRRQRIDAVMREVLPQRRHYWASLCAWTAATLKEGAEAGDDSWRELALSARALAGDDPLDAISVARRIAGATVDVYMQR